MPESYVDGAMTRAAETASRVVKDVQKRLGTVAETQPPRVLSPKQQLERFINMRHDDLVQLKERHGEQAFNRYVVRMRQLAREVS